MRAVSTQFPQNDNIITTYIIVHTIPVKSKPDIRKFKLSTLPILHPKRLIAYGNPIHVAWNHIMSFKMIPSKPTGYDIIAF